MERKKQSGGPFHDKDIERGSSTASSLNTVKRQGAPPTSMASPITTGFSPSQDGTLDDLVNIGRPEDTVGFLPSGKGRRKR